MAPPGTPGLSPHHLDHPILPGSGQGGSIWLAPSRVPPASALLSAPPRPRFASPRGAPGACPLPTPSSPSPGRGSHTPHLSGAWRADWACSGARPRAVGAERMHSPGQGLAVQGRGAQAAALADALASLRRTRARMASLTAYGTAGGRAGGAWDRTGTPGNFGFEYVCGAARQGAKPLGSGTHVRGKGRLLGNQEAGTCQLSPWGPQKAHIGELRSSRKIPLSVEFSQGTRGVRFCLGFEP